MKDDESTQAAGGSPRPAFHFQVQWGQALMWFHEISGLDIDAQTVEYGHGDSPAFSVLKMPGIRKYGNVTMKRGVARIDTSFWDWVNRITTNAAERTAMTVALLDEAGNPVMVWGLANAWPVKINGPDLKADGNDVAIESLEIAHEGLVVRKA